MSRVMFTELWDELVSEGTTSFTAAALEQRTGASRDAVYAAVKYATDRHRLFSPARGFYVVVPAEYRKQGVVPAMHFIDPMMNHLGAGYYVAYASAAQWWGAAHQPPQEFRVVTDKPVRDRDLGRLRLRFHTSPDLDTDEIARVAGPRTMVNVASPVLCAVDLAHRPRAAGGLGNVATILGELPDLDGHRLAGVAAGRPRSTARRLGWLLELSRDDVDLAGLARLARPDAGQPTLLVPDGPHDGRIDERWGLVVNADIEPDDT